MFGVAGNAPATEMSYARPVTDNAPPSSEYILRPGSVRGVDKGVGNMFLTRSLILVALIAVPALAEAGVPRNMMLSADEQLADENTGVTIARGNAEVTVGTHRIHGTADVIEVRPKINEILFKGRAKLSVGAANYDSDTVACTLDFTHCATVSDEQDLPPLPQSAAAVTTPR